MDLLFSLLQLYHWSLSSKCLFGIRFTLSIKSILPAITVIITYVSAIAGYFVQQIAMYSVLQCWNGGEICYFGISFSTSLFSNYPLSTLELVRKLWRNIFFSCTWSRWKGRQLKVVCRILHDYVSQIQIVTHLDEIISNFPSIYNTKKSLI